MPIATFDDRALVSVTGADAEHLLQNIVTADLDVLGEGEARPCALLTPQGKILFDFLISRQADDGLLIECRADVADDLVRRLMLYRLRARADIAKRDQGLVEIRWGDDSSTSQSDPTGALRDARFAAPATVTRRYLRGAAGGSDHTAWQAFRIASGVAESGADYALGDAFPHDVLLDQNAGVGFRKGCYVGQEVVSRMQHRGTARRRILLVAAEASLPAAGTDIVANGRSVGTLGSVSGRSGLAMVRIDKVKAAMDAAMPVTAANVALELSIPHWATFSFPQDLPAAEDA